MAGPSAEKRGVPAIAPACVVVRGGTATGKTRLARGAQSDAGKGARDGRP